MAFFKTLKSRLFGKKEDSAKVTNIDKTDKEVEKEIQRRRKKEKKVNKYVAGLKKTSLKFSDSIKELKNKHNKLDEDFFDDLEEILIMSDISMNLVIDIIDEIKREVRLENVSDTNLIAEIISDKMFSVYANRGVVDTRLKINKNGLTVYLVVGVNGAGKTTSIAKLAHKFKNENKKVIVAAADTFRAGAVEQLKVWTERIGVDIVTPVKEGVDPASVVYDALAETSNSDYDVLIIDTAGRLQNKVNLMNELEKMNKIIVSKVPGAPHESLLVLDATTGQNGVSQAVNFKDVTNLTGIILTKMDGTSKGGIILTIKDKLDIAVKAIGLGEKLDDLQEFDLDSFIYGMTKGLNDED